MPQTSDIYVFLLYTIRSPTASSLKFAVQPKVPQKRPMFEQMSSGLSVLAGLVDGNGEGKTKADGWRHQLAFYNLNQGDAQQKAM